ncbi:MAG: hypothetical protein HQM14_15615 [SAR324 cluster bacterium]|nr:hypothetical protein [SAR324 cluster bacterium]
MEAPLFVSRASDLLAGAMIPTMLFALGVQLASMGRPRFCHHGCLIFHLGQSGDVNCCYLFSLMKILLRHREFGACFSLEVKA